MALKALKMEKEKIPSVEAEMYENSSAESRANELAELRRLLIQAEEVSEVLPNAISHSTQKDKQLANATLPLVEDNIRQSVQQNPEILAEALFPVIGPAIRKAIAEALSQMVQSLNKTLENSVSPKGLRWRFEAWQTGKPFAEVVMLNSLLYRVEEVFLIHRETGGLLQHVSSSNKDASQDADMVSAMLTAIQDFARDSFKESENATLDSLQLNDLSVWLERSPDAILAGVIRGNPPLTLREIFKEAIEAIQFVQQEDFENFNGDIDIFEKSRPMLDNCLQFQLSNSETKDNSSFLKPSNILLGSAGILILVLGFIYVLDYWRWSSYLNRLKTESGIVVTETDRGWLKNSITGLRDPLAIDPESILGEYNLEKDEIDSNWKAYQDLSSTMVLARANQLLKPPDGVKLTLENNFLLVSGNASNQWFNEAKKLSAALAGTNGIRFSPEALKTKIESQSIYFNCRTTDFAKGEDSKIDEIVSDLEILKDSADNWQLEIDGMADKSGTPEMNEKISNLRAIKIAELLKSKSEKLKAAGQSIKPVGIGTNNGSACKVDFNVILIKQ